jgi:hypothetical protein
VGCLEHVVQDSGMSRGTENPFYSFFPDGQPGSPSMVTPQAVDI